MSNNDKFKDSKDTWSTPLCNDCMYYQGGRKCLAYKEIPDEILSGEIDHKSPYKNDNGIVYKKNAG